MTRPILVAILASLVLILQPVLPHRLADGGFSAAAWADDDDDDGGGDGGGDDDDDDGARGFGGQNNDDDDDGGSRSARPSGGGGGFLGALFGSPRQPSSPSPAPSPAPPTAAPNEIVVLALDEADLGTLLTQGFTVIEERELQAFDAVSRRLRIPPGVTLEEARSTARALPSGQDADFNHFYRPEEIEGDATCTGADCPAGDFLDWPYGLPRYGTCGTGAPIGMIDTGINEDHETFDGARLEVTRLGRDDLDPSRAIHGTAVAALLVGQPGTRSPGLLPGTRLVAVDAFHRVGGDERADVFSLVEGLDLLVREQVSVINLSLAGPPNSVLEEVVDRLVISEDIVLVSAVGNDGPAADPAFPAAYEPVIAVTAVDRSGNAYRRAVRGAHVDIAAPGVEVWTAASVSGARWKTGTSFAVPFATAAAAILRDAQPDLTVFEVTEELMSRAVDLGEPGRDRVFGAGRVDLDAICPR
jgi:hypothetical protein